MSKVNITEYMSRDQQKFVRVAKLSWG